MPVIVTDECGRLVMPPELPANSAVTIQQIDKDTWIVKKRRKDEDGVAYILIPVINCLPDDSNWEKMEEFFGRHTSARLVVPDE